MTNTFVVARLYLKPSDNEGDGGCGPASNLAPDPDPILRALFEDLLDSAHGTETAGSHTAFTQGDSKAAALCRSGEASFDIVLECGDAAELARLTLGMVLRAPVAAIGWLDPDAVLNRETFLAALAPRPARVTALAEACTPRPRKRAVTQRLQRDARRAVSDRIVRHSLTTQAEAEELAQIRRELGIRSPEQRAACHALISTSALIAMNATQAAAGVLY